GRNKRSNRMLELRGERLCLTEWAELVGLSVAAIRNRLSAGWTAEAALTVPKRGHGPCKKSSFRAAAKTCGASLRHFHRFSPARRAPPLALLGASSSGSRRRRSRRSSNPL